MHKSDKWSTRYCTASIFLSLLLAVVIALIAQRHVELIKALDDQSNCTQWVLDLSTKVGKCGEEQLTELKVCRADYDNLTEIVGRCVVYKQNLEDHSSALAVVQQRELLDKMIKDSQDQTIKESQRSDNCDKRLKKFQDEVMSLLKSSQKLLVEKEICSLKLKTSQESLTVCENNLVNKPSEQLSDTQQEHSSVQDDITAPIEEFTISDFSEKKEANKEWYSSPFYTNNRGYKFRLKVFPNGNDDGSGTHLSVFAQLMRGEYDNELEWPFEGDIRVELLNWRADKNHHWYTISFSRYTDHNLAFRVTDQETAIGFGYDKFISHTDLVSTTNSEYLRDDYLKLRVSAIVYSTPLLPLTPAWQDSLSTTQSGAQFTITEYSKRKQFNNQYFSPPFTTSPQGYTLCLRVDANGQGSGKGSHLSIFAYIMKGQHDDRLQWPFTGTIIIELLNWLEDKGHYKETLSIDTNDEFVRVITDNKEPVYGNNTGYPQFISQSSLNSSTNPQYLYQDCIRVRVQAIANN